VPQPGWEESRSPLLHLVAIAALVVLVVNDHILKGAWPGLVTGKASDVAALILVPVLAVDIARLLAGGRLLPRTRAQVASAAALLIAATFVAVKLHPFANEAYAFVMGLVQWPGSLLGSLVGGAPLVAPGRAPTVLDAGDLIALPAAAVGWAIAAGRAPQATLRWRPPPDLRVALRIAILVAALFALAATSQSPPVQVTDVAQDEVILSPGDQPVHRRLSVLVHAGATTTSPTVAPAPLRIVIEARPLWPLVDPPARFVVSRIGRDGGLEPSAGSGFTVDPRTCGGECTVDVDVAVDWPASADRPRSSVAWELVATAWAVDGYIYGSIDVSGDGLHRTAGGSGVWWLALLAAIPFAAVVAGRRLAALVRIGRHGAQAAGDWAVIVATSVLAVGLTVVPFVVPPSTLEPAAGGVAAWLEAIGPVLGFSIGAGLVRWWAGAGGFLAAVVLGGSFIGLLFGARLAIAASQTFLERGIEIAIAATLLAGVALVGGVARAGGDDGEDASGRVSPARIIVAGTQFALVIGLAATNALAALLLAIALLVWWNGRGHLLGLVSFVLGGWFAVMLVLGPSFIFGGRWGAIESTSLFLGGIAALIGVLVAFGGFARHPNRPGGEEATRAAVAKAIAERATEPPPS
jgi:hypothetical protein